MAGGGGETQTISVPKPAVGVVIGKGGDMISQIQNVTATRIQFKPGKRLSILFLHIMVRALDLHTFLSWSNFDLIAVVPSPV